MKKTTCFLLSLVLLCAVIISGCSKEPEYILTTDYFGSGFSWDMTMDEAYSKLDDYGDSVEVEETSSGTEFSGGIFSYSFNENGRLISVEVSYGQDIGAKDLAISQLGEPDAEDDEFVEWYRLMDDAPTMVKFFSTKDEYLLLFSLRDEALKEADGTTLQEMYDQVVTAIDTKDFEATVEPLYFLNKIDYRDSSALYKTRDEAWMRHEAEQGNYEKAWGLRFDVTDEALVQECAYRVAEIYLLEGSNEKRTDAAKILEEYCEGYEDAALLLDYCFARTLEMGDIFSARDYYAELPPDLLDVADRLAAIDAYSSWNGTFVCTSYQGAEQKFADLEIKIAFVDGKTTVAVTGTYRKEIAPIGGMYSATYSLDATEEFKGANTFTATPPAYPRNEFTFSPEEISLKVTNKDGTEDFYRFTLDLNA